MLSFISNSFFSSSSSCFFTSAVFFSSLLSFTCNGFFPSSSSCCFFNSSNCTCISSSCTLCSPSCFSNSSFFCFNLSAVTNTSSCCFKISSLFSNPICFSFTDSNCFCNSLFSLLCIYGKASILFLVLFSISAKELEGKVNRFVANRLATAITLYFFIMHTPF
ncbi:hypothetical protein B4088_0261 [Bacillus cereus]|uniref:Uncharacterized protein n=1 Tax=Bacillus cereus TaxID=1396 RepID=A0A164QZT2_BACCE|nr:hypothetical protein B4088_0261 [Bacillus cereus]